MCHWLQTRYCNQLAAVPMVWVSKEWSSGVCSILASRLSTTLMFEGQDFSWKLVLQHGCVLPLSQLACRTPLAKRNARLWCQQHTRKSIPALATCQPAATSVSGFLIFSLSRALLWPQAVLLLFTSPLFYQPRCVLSVNMHVIKSHVQLCLSIEPMSGMGLKLPNGRFLETTTKRLTQPDILDKVYISCSYKHL